jgi:hypothetical protein
MFCTLILLNRYDYSVNQSHIKITIHYLLLLLLLSINSLKYVKIMKIISISLQAMSLRCITNRYLRVYRHRTQKWKHQTFIPSHETSLRHTLWIWRYMIDKLNQLITHTHTVPLSLALTSALENWTQRPRATREFGRELASAAVCNSWWLHRNQRAMEGACTSSGEGRGKRGDALKPHNNLNMSLGCVRVYVCVYFYEWKWMGNTHAMKRVNCTHDNEPLTSIYGSTALC